VHLSSAGALETLERAHDEGVPLTAETAPHYLHFVAESVPDGATWFKCAPPIRERANRERLWEAVRRGSIEMVVSDHSPCIPELKRPDEGDFMGAWGGIAGVQFSLCAVWTEAKARGFTLSDLVRWMCTAPARHAALSGKKGVIAAGADADLVVFDAGGTTTVERSRIEHRHKLTPYDGETLSGAVVATYLRGEEVYGAGKCSAQAAGRWLRGGKA
jgi:allantoinase